MTVFLRLLLIALICFNPVFAYAQQDKVETAPKSRAEIRAERAEKKNPQKKLTVAVFGDDMIYGAYVDAYEDFASALERQLLMSKFAGAKVYNLSILGKTSIDAAKEISKVLIKKPDIVILAFGHNDIMDMIPANTIYYNLLPVIKALQEKNIQILLVGIKPPANYNPDATKKINGMYRYLAKTYNIPLYADFMEGTENNPVLLNENQIYPSRRGISTIVKRMFPQIEKMALSVAQKQQ